MHRLRIWSTAPGLLLALVLPAGVASADERADARKLAATIDRIILARLRENGVKPAPLADDAVLQRRLALDLRGRIPLVAETRRYLADPASDRYEGAVESLLASPGYAAHFSNVWCELLLPGAQADFEKRFLIPSMESWLEKRFAANVPYDRMVRALLTVPLKNDQPQRFAFGPNQAEPTALPFYQVHEGKPEELAAATARLFLGVRIECAQCHDHPFGRWKREQLWGLAAFFAGVRGQGGGVYGQLHEVLDRRELAIPRTERVAQARFLDDSLPRTRYRISPRVALADWITRADNPYFARAAVNRLWAHFFGIGIVEPVDDFNDDNPPSHPELLDELARAFVAHKYDLKFLMRAITYSQTYRRSSVHNQVVPPDPRLFACAPVRGLSAEQLFDSFIAATGYRDGLNRRQQLFGIGNPRQVFLEKFRSQERRADVETSIPQALALMNSALVRTATHPERGNTLAAVANAPFLSTAGKIETLYLAALARRPTPQESARLVAYVEKGGPRGDRKKALSDVFWALLNSPEFLFNH